MGRSSLIDVVSLSPGDYGKRPGRICRITPHCYVGQVTAERIAKSFDSIAKQASANYGIGYDGRVLLNVEEDRGAWTSSDQTNDLLSVTMEIASDNAAPYAFTDAAYNKMLDLMTDICKRNGIRRLLWIPDKSKALAYSPAEDEAIITVHRWFAARACPGDWLMERLPTVAHVVTDRLEEAAPKVRYRVQVGSFANKSNADALLARLKASGYEDAYITKVTL